MYAVIRTGGKQYSVAQGDSVEVERLAGDIGQSITIQDVLLVADGDKVSVGAPVVEGASVTAKITGQYRGTKIIVFKYRPKKRIRVRRGHRQYITRLQIESINA
ncbi:MAG: 50S ribosomal protein L21 [Anaerolineales bacterium]|nr:50S ribosomal protein L21 [Anaerolineales bacterium]